MLYGKFDLKTGEISGDLRRVYESGESWVCMLVLRGEELSDGEIEQLNERPIHAFYGGPGMKFSHGWHWERRGRRIIGLCNGGVDC